MPMFIFGMKALVFSASIILMNACLLRVQEANAAAPVCTAAEQSALLAPASRAGEYVMLRCSPRLDASSVITRRIVLEGPAASGVVIACNGATIGRRDQAAAAAARIIEIRSERRGASEWAAPSEVVIRDCHVFGSLAVHGMALNGQGDDLRLSSYREGHTSRARAAAPHIIVLDNLSVLTTTRTTPLYLSPGVHNVTLRNSTLRGEAHGIAIYLDAESGDNVIENNTIDVKTGREVIAVDGSSNNRIIGNRIVLYGQGAIHLYRNCGEGGTVRHQTPSYNTITNNFFHKVGSTRVRTVVVGSREDWIRRVGGSFCHLDDGYPFGSSIDNGDHATHNVVDSNRTVEGPL